MDNKLTLADFVNSNGSSAQLVNTSNFSKEVHENPILEYLTFGQYNCLSMDMDNKESLKNYSINLFQQNLKLNLEGSKERIGELEAKSEICRLKNFYNPFNKAYKEQPLKFKAVMTACGAGMIGGMVYCTVTFAPLLVLPVGAAVFVDRFRRLLKKGIDSELNNLREKVREYETFKENVNKSVVKCQYFPVAEKMVVKAKEIEKQRKEFPFITSPQVDYQTLNNIIMDIYTGKK